MVRLMRIDQLGVLYHVTAPRNDGGPVAGLLNCSQEEFIFRMFRRDFKFAALRPNDTCGTA
jgi:hypothetical protein